MGNLTSQKPNNSFTIYDCDICKDDGKCLNSESHKDYEKNEQWDDPFGYMDCINYSERKSNTQGQWIKGYIKKLQEKKKYEKDFLELRVWLNDNNQSLGDYICESYIELIKPCFSN